MWNEPWSSYILWKLHMVLLRCIVCYGDNQFYIELFFRFKKNQIIKKTKGANQHVTYTFFSTVFVLITKWICILILSDSHRMCDTTCVRWNKNKRKNKRSVSKCGNVQNAIKSVKQIFVRIADTKRKWKNSKHFHPNASGIACQKRKMVTDYLPYFSFGTGNHGGRRCGSVSGDLE